ncbi:DUF1365 domain-containing protein [Pyruvatibacter mobilis]|uniref:DUF1365 domain-containing protein n=1 Tax=Pyruvatibacter mobilis TaxID=1712261 RepID=UPI003BB1173A
MSITEAPANGISAPPARLYFGRVMHARSRPRTHRFIYRVFSMLIDIDRVQEAGRRSRLFSIDRFNLFSFHRKDHGPRDGSSLRAHIVSLLTEAGISEPRHIRLLCYPRILGYVFNPLSVYYCYDAQARLTTLVYQVHNTFGDVHSYVAPVQAPERDGRIVRQSRDKNLHVSPFVGMAATYDFALDDPAERIAIHIRESDENGPFLLATFDGEARPFTTRSLATAFVIYPLMTVKVMAAIHFEALRLWLKGVPFFRSPGKPPALASADGPSGGPRGNAIDPAKAPATSYPGSSNAKAA